HKRRISWNKFYKQVYKFGLVRPILNAWHPKTKKITYWFPTLFCLGFLLACLLYIFGSKFLILTYMLYFVCAFIAALILTKSLPVALLSILAIVIQFFGYGYGFFKSTWVVAVLKKEPQV